MDARMAPSRASCTRPHRLDVRSAGCGSASSCRVTKPRVAPRYRWIDPPPAIMAGPPALHPQQRRDIEQAHDQTTQLTDPDLAAVIRVLSTYGAVQGYGRRPCEEWQELLDALRSGRAIGPDLPRVPGVPPGQREPPRSLNERHH